jgi:hypothetical protein
MRGLPKFRETLEVLDRGRVECILVGGVAAVLQGAPISTLDTDIVYRRTADNIERLVAALCDLEAIYRDPAGRRIEPDATRFATGGHHLFQTRLGPLDVLATIGADRTYEDLEPQAARYVLEGGLNVLLLDLRAIIETKEQAGRSKDLLALPVLRETLRLREAERSAP